LHCLPRVPPSRDTAKGEELFKTYGMTVLEVTEEVFESEASIVRSTSRNTGMHTIRRLLVASCPRRGSATAKPAAPPIIIRYMVVHDGCSRLSPALRVSKDAGIADGVRTRSMLRLEHLFGDLETVHAVGLEELLALRRLRDCGTREGSA